MFLLFSSLKSLWAVKNTVIEGPVFRLHCKWTVLFLLCCSVLLSCRQYFGDPIHCIQGDATRLEALETFCWIHATFILPHAWNGTIGDDVPHPGIKTHVRGHNRVYHGYYQWVAFVLLLQGIMFYVPKYLWKSWEKGTIKALCLDLQDPILTSKQVDSSVGLLVNALKLHWGHFNSYVSNYFFCECLNLLNIVGQMFVMDKFFGGVFTTLGLDVLQWSEWDQDYRTDPLVEAFPRMTKCVFHEYGPSGTVAKHDALCLLPLNILNEKIVIFLWFWFLFLCVMSSFIILYRVILACIPLFRYYVLLSRATRVSKGALDKLMMKASLGDWFVMYQLAKNIDPTHYRVLIGQLTSSMMQNGDLSMSLTTIGEKEKIDFV